MIGTDIADWAAVEGAYYAGMGSEALWLALSLVLCIAALTFGARHERAAYRRAR
jgi:hypothetical protein